jgi:hypothetical protein
MRTGRRLIARVPAPGQLAPVRKAGIAATKVQKMQTGRALLVSFTRSVTLAEEENVFFGKL